MSSSGSWTTGPSGPKASAARQSGLKRRPASSAASTQRRRLTTPSGSRSVAAAPGSASRRAEEQIDLVEAGRGVHELRDGEEPAGQDLEAGLLGAPRGAGWPRGSAPRSAPPPGAHQRSLSLARVGVDQQQPPGGEDHRPDGEPRAGGRRHGRPRREPRSRGPSCGPAAPRPCRRGGPRAPVIVRRGRRLVADQVQHLGVRMPARRRRAASRRSRGRAARTGRSGRRPRSSGRSCAPAARSR